MGPRHTQQSALFEASAPGPVTRWLIRRLVGRPTGADLPWSADADPLSSDDLQMALHILYDLDYRGVAGVDPDRERDRLVQDLLVRLEDEFLVAVLNLVRTDDGDRWARQAVADGPGPTVDALLAAFDGPSLSTYMADHGDRGQFLEFMIHRSAYQLKEADPHTMGLARLVPGDRKAAYTEIQFDEYGGGRRGQSHAELFARAMTEAGLDSSYGHYLDRLPGVTLATGNLLNLFASRRCFLPHLVGHLALFEMTSVGPMSRYASAAARLRLGPAVQRFYALHVEADQHHGRLAREVLLGNGDHETVVADGLDPAAMVIGAHALLLIEDRFARHLLASWWAGRSALRDVATLAGAGSCERVWPAQSHRRAF